MTKLPHENWDVKGVDGPKYKVGPHCSVPACIRYADHGHHLWRRSFVTGDYRWVRLWDGTVLQNISALCYEHHRQVTENDSTITYIDELKEFHWQSVDNFGPLTPQPKTLAQFEGRPMQITVGGEEVPHVHRDEEETCPTCGRKKKPKDELPPGEKRPRATWSVSVPKDERENGAEVLDTLEWECAVILEREEHTSHKYFVLAEVMAHFLQTHGRPYAGERVNNEEGA